MRMPFLALRLSFLGAGTPRAAAAATCRAHGDTRHACVGGWGVCSEAAPVCTKDMMAGHLRLVADSTLHYDARHAHLGGLALRLELACRLRLPLLCSDGSGAVGQRSAAARVRLRSFPAVRMHAACAGAAGAALLRALRRRPATGSSSGGAPPLRRQHSLASLWLWLFTRVVRLFFFDIACLPSKQHSQEQQGPKAGAGGVQRLGNAVSEFQQLVSRR